MGNKHLLDPKLSLKAKGLLSLLLSLRDGGHFSMTWLARMCRDCSDAIRSALKELEMAGYVTIRKQEHDSKGRMTEVEYIVYEQPHEQESETSTSGQPVTDLSETEQPQTEKPEPGNPTQLKNNPTSTVVSSTTSLPFPSVKPTAEPQERNRTEVTPNTLEAYEEIIKDHIEYNILVNRSDIDRERLNEIVSLILEIYCSTSKTIRIARNDYPAKLVQDRFRKLNSSHIRFVLECLDRNTSDIKNMKQYLKTTLFNAPATITSHYASRVAHDMAAGMI